MLERLDQFLLKCLNHSSSSNFLVTYKTYKKVWKKKLKMAASAGSMKPHAYNHMSFFYSKSTCHQAHWIVVNSSTAFFGNVLFLTASWTMDHTFRSIWWCIILQRNPPSQFHPFTQIKLDNTSLTKSPVGDIIRGQCPPNYLPAQFLQHQKTNQEQTFQNRVWMWAFSWAEVLLDITEAGGVMTCTADHLQGATQTFWFPFLRAHMTSKSWSSLCRLYIH